MKRAFWLLCIGLGMLAAEVCDLLFKNRKGRIK